MPKLKHFDRAVTLAAAFVANGDIRIDNVSIRVDTTPFHRLEELIVVLAQTLDIVEARLADRENG